MKKEFKIYNVKFLPMQTFFPNSEKGRICLFGFTGAEFDPAEGHGWIRTSGVMSVIQHDDPAPGGVVMLVETQNSLYHCMSVCPNSNHARAVYETSGRVVAADSTPPANMPIPYKVLPHKPIIGPTLVDKLNQAMSDLVTGKTWTPELQISKVLGAHIEEHKSWDEVAKHVGMARSSLKRSLDGEHRPTYHTLHRVLIALGVLPTFGYINQPTHVTPADGNIFADLGFPVDEAKQLKAQAEAQLKREASVWPFPADCSHIGRIVRIVDRHLALTNKEPHLEETIFELGGDSLDVVEIILDVEQAFDVEIPDDAVGDESQLTIGRLVSIVQQLKPEVK